MKRFGLLWSMLLFATASFGQTAKIAPDLTALLSHPLAPVTLVIQYNNLPGPLNIANILSLGGTIQHQYVSIPALVVKLPAAVVAALSLDPAIAYISPDRSLQGTVDLTTASANADYAFQSGLTGAGVAIAIVDSGIYSHPDLAGR